MFYSKNKFILRVIHDTDVRLLLKLNGHILSTMNSLSIRLNSWPCVRGHEGTLIDGVTCRQCPSMPPLHLSTSSRESSPASSSSRHSTPPKDLPIFIPMNADYALNLASPAGQSLLTEWKQALSHLASRIPPGQPRFFLFCDVEDLTSGRALLEPLLELSLLLECGIRLNRHRNYELSALARDTATQITQKPASLRRLQSFPFQSLPQELRLHILRYTHLVQLNSYRQCDSIVRIRDGRLLRKDSKSRTPLDKCCRRCSETLIDCCCSSTHASYSSTCICRDIPVELFLVSKEMRHDAYIAFFNHNTFEFSQDPEETLHFLFSFPEGYLKYTRHIQFRFQEREVLLWTQEDYGRKWQALVLFLKEHFKIPQLSIAIWADTFELGAMDDFGTQQRNIYDVYCDITRSLRLLQGLGSVRFDLGYFAQLGPLMSRAIIGPGHEEEYPDFDFASSHVRRADHEISSWFKEYDLMGDGELEGSNQH
jgi:hypothetical protein